MMAALPLAGMVALCGLAGWAVAGMPGAIIVAVASLISPIIDQRLMHKRGPSNARRDPQRKRLSPGFADQLARLGENAGLDQPPELWWVDGPPNAFALIDGASPKIVVAESLHDLLSERQLRAVIAHEMAHARAGDATWMRRAEVLTRVSLIVALLALVIGAAAFILKGWMLAPNWAWWTLAVGPTALSWASLALMRRREFSADAEAAQMTGDPQALSQALARIQFATSGPPDLKATIEEYAGIRSRGWWRTHPPIEQRIARLNSQ